MDDNTLLGVNLDQVAVDETNLRRTKLESPGDELAGAKHKRLQALIGDSDYDLADLSQEFGTNMEPGYVQGTQ